MCPDLPALNEPSNPLGFIKTFKYSTNDASWKIQMISDTKEYAGNQRRVWYYWDKVRVDIFPPDAEVLLPIGNSGSYVEAI